jgi:hypothetical protein
MRKLIRNAFGITQHHPSKRDYPIQVLKFPATGYRYSTGWGGCTGQFNGMVRRFYPEVISIPGS